jgi:putative oxidoreductase
VLVACIPELGAETGKNHPFALFGTIAAVGGIFLLAGLWTPFAGALIGFVEIWMAFVKPAQWESYALAAGIATALALLGPGSWSLDARLYGRKRISIQNR